MLEKSKINNLLRASIDLLKFIGSYIGGYFIVIVIAIFFFFTIYLKYAVTLGSFQFVTNDNSQIVKYFFNQFKEDFEHKVSYKDFEQFYKDIGFLIQVRQLEISQDKSIGKQLSDARENNKYTKNMENFESGSYFTVIDKLQSRLKGIDNYYLHPLNTTRDLYIHIDILKRSIFAISKDEFESLNDKYISFQLAGNIIVINKQEILEQYSKSLKQLIDISKVSQENSQEVFRKEFKDIFIFYTLSLVLFFFISMLSLFFYFRNKEKRYINLEEKESRLNFDKNIIDARTARLNQIEHLMQHDLKTNIDERLNYLSIIYEDIKEKGNENSLEAFLSMYTLDLTIKQANDYLPHAPISVPYFYDVFKKENIFKFATKQLETYGDIGNKILSEIIIFDIDKNMENINDFPVKDIYQNEFSSLLFRLINNALKHSLYKKVFVRITKDKNNYLNIKISNSVKNVEKAMFAIETSLQSKDNVKNVTIVHRSIKKFGMKLEYEKDEKNSIIVANISKG